MKNTGLPHIDIAYISRFENAPDLAAAITAAFGAFRTHNGGLGEHHSWFDFLAGDEKDAQPLDCGALGYPTQQQVEGLIANKSFMCLRAMHEAPPSSLQTKPFGKLNQSALVVMPTLLRMSWLFADHKQYAPDSIHTTVTAISKALLNCPSMIKTNTL